MKKIVRFDLFRLERYTGCIIRRNAEETLKIYGGLGTENLLYRRPGRKLD